MAKEGGIPEEYCQAVGDDVRFGDERREGILSWWVA